MPPTQLKRARVCYLNGEVREKFERLPLRETERKLIKKVWSILPHGRHAFEYPADGKAINGMTFVFRLSSAASNVILTDIEARQVQRLGWWEKAKGFIWSIAVWFLKLWLLGRGRD